MSEQKPNDVSDALIVSARTDREAFGRLFEAYYERIFWYCQRRLYDRTVAEDVCSEVFLFVARRMRSFRGSTEQDFRRWVYRIATTEVNACLRKTRRRKELWDAGIEQKQIETEAYVKSNVSDEGEGWTIVYQTIRQLSTKEQTIVMLRLFEELPYEEISHVMKVRTGTARVIFSRAIQKLRKLLPVESVGENDRSVRRV